MAADSGEFLNFNAATRGNAIPSAYRGLFNFQLAGHGGNAPSFRNGFLCDSVFHGVIKDTRKIYSQ